MSEPSIPAIENRNRPDPCDGQARLVWVMGCLLDHFSRAEVGSMCPTAIRVGGILDVPFHIVNSAMSRLVQSGIVEQKGSLRRLVAHVPRPDPDVPWSQAEIDKIVAAATRPDELPDWPRQQPSGDERARSAPPASPRPERPARPRAAREPAPRSPARQALPAGWSSNAGVMGVGNGMWLVTSDRGAPVVLTVTGTHVAAALVGDRWSVPATGRVVPTGAEGFDLVAAGHRPTLTGLADAAREGPTSADEVAIVPRPLPTSPFELRWTGTSEDGIHVQWRVPEQRDERDITIRASRTGLALFGSVTEQPLLVTKTSVHIVANGALFARRPTQRLPVGAEMQKLFGAVQDERLSAVHTLLSMLGPRLLALLDDRHPEMAVYLGGEISRDSA